MGSGDDDEVTRVPGIASSPHERGDLIDRMEADAIRSEMASYRARLAQVEQDLAELRSAGLSWLVFVIKKLLFYGSGFLRDIQGHEDRPVTKPPKSRR